MDSTNLNLIKDFCTDFFSEKRSAVLWGYGKLCREILNNFKTNLPDLHIEAIIDNNSDNKKIVSGIPVVNPSQIDLTNKKILITTSSYYDEIKADLEKQGMKENVDFCDIRTFISGASWFKNQKVVLTKLIISITTACTLNCKHCSMYMPFHKKNTIMYSFEEVKQQIDLLFKYVDNVMELVVIGGEPFLNKDLSRIIEYMQVNYSDHFNTLNIITNGTIIPDKQLIETLKYQNVVVNISNYYVNEGYINKFNQVKSLLEEHQIRISVNNELEWKDFSFPYEGLHLSDEDAYINMNKCDPYCRGFNDSKFYFCHFVWSADKAGIFKEDAYDYVDFSSLSIDEKEKIVLMNLCYFNSGYNSLCRECGGFSNLNQKIIKAGQQSL